jgi:hypothetical protein
VSGLAADLRDLGLSGPGPGTVPRTRRLPAWPMWIWVGALYAVAVAVILTLALRVPSPWIMVDELVYSDTARSIAGGAGFTVRGHASAYGYVYPLLLSIPYAVANHMTDVYALARVVNALVMCSVVVPVYLLARRVVRPGAAFVAAALSVAAPPMVYVASLMTENVFYPLFVWLALALVAALDRPTLRRQSVVVALCVVAFLVRAQAIALFAAVLTAPPLLAWVERGRPRSLRSWRPLYSLAALAAVAVVVVETARGRSIFSVLGGYSVAGNTTYHFWPVLKWVVLHLAGLALSLWVIPAAALIVVLASARHLDRQLRLFAAATASLGAWLVLEVGVFASRYSLRIEERNLFYLVPLFVIALLAWIERGQPRPPRATVVAAVLAVALVGTIPFVSLLNENSQSDTPFLQPWWYLGDTWTGRATVALVASLTALVLAAVFLWLPARFAPWLPALVAAGFLLTWIPLEASPRGFPQASVHQYDAAVAAGTSWIDRAVGPNANVAVLWSGGSAIRVWENEFWNRSIRRVYGLDGAELAGGMPQTDVTERPSTSELVDGHGRPLDAEYVLTDSRAPIVGMRVATDDAHLLALYRVRSPARLALRITGWLDDGWTGPEVTWSRTQCAGGSGLRFDVHSDAGLFKGIVQHMAVSGTTPAQTFVVHPGDEPRVHTLELQPRNGHCTVHFRISPARVPADYPQLHSQDNRLLGLRIDYFTYKLP